MGDTDGCQKQLAWRGAYRNAKRQVAPVNICNTYVYVMITD
jgi:hypothetical protein